MVVESKDKKEDNLSIKAESSERIPSELLSDRSSDENKYPSNEDFFPNSQTLKIKEHHYDGDLIEKYEDNLRRLSEENSYLRDEICSLGVALDGSAKQTEEARREHAKLSS